MGMGRRGCWSTGFNAVDGVVEPQEVTMIYEEMKLIPVQPQPEYIESSGRWKWPLPEQAIFPGCCADVVTASREWWEYAPSEAKPHPPAPGMD